MFLRATSSQSDFSVTSGEDKVSKKSNENESLSWSIMDNTDDGFQPIELIHMGNGGCIVNYRVLRVNAAYEKQTTTSIA